MTRPNILVIGNVLDNSGYGKAIRIMVDDFRRFANIRCLYIDRGDKQAPNVDFYKKFVTNKVEGYDGYFVEVDLDGLWANKKFSYFFAHEFEELPNKAEKLTGCKNIITYTEDISNKIKEKFNVNCFKYLPSLFIPPTTDVQPDSKYVFYSMNNNISPRKHVLESIISYLFAFTNKDNVLYYVKTLPKQKETLNNEIKSVIASSGFNLRSDLPPIYLDDSEYSDDYIYKIHARNTCYVGISYGEGLNLGLYEAAKIGNPIIYNSLPPYMEYFYNYFKDGMVSSYKDIGVHLASSASSNFNEYTTEWVTPLMEISQKMKFMYDNDIRKESIPSFDWSVYDNTKEIVDVICCSC